MADMRIKRWPRASRPSSRAAFSASKSIAAATTSRRIQRRADGYVREDYAIALAKKAGFVLAGSSEINANPKDTKDWVDGVWTLPPTLSQGDKDRAKYIAVGEADNFVLQVPQTDAVSAPRRALAA